MDDLPPERRQVRLIAQGRVFDAVRGVPPGGSGTIWGVRQRTGGVAQWLPGLYPDAWQPMSLATWEWPRGEVPEPLASTSGLMWSSTTRFGAVEDAESDELARDMERDRDCARRGSSRDGEAAAPEPQKWRDVHEVAYREPGAVTVADVEARVCRALSYDRLIPLDIKRQRTNAAVLADMKQWMEVSQADPTVDWRPPFKPTAEDIADYLRVMDWIAEVYCDTPGGWEQSREATILAGRIKDPPEAWEEIAEGQGVSRQAARKRYDRLMQKLAAVANGGADGKLAALAARVQESNRAFKRGAA